MDFMRGFASDNNAGAHTKIIEAILRVNHDHVIGYGDDPVTAHAVMLLKKEFGEHTEPYFVFNGTAANVLSLLSIMKPYHAVVCSELAHINVDECGAPEHITGNKIIAVPHTNGKVTIDRIEPLLHAVGVEHHAQPKVISISQTTEVGTVYTPKELRALADFAHSHDMYLHVDGARFCNAAAALGCSLRALSTDVGVDVLSFGGTKNGLMFGEAVVFFNPKLAEGFKYTRKQNMQLMSKMRYVSAQFEAYLTDELWRTTALHANNAARRLAEKLSTVPGVTITQSVEANGVFAIVPEHVIESLRSKYFFYTWDESRHEVRFMASFDTTDDDVNGFVTYLSQLLKQ